MEDNKKFYFRALIAGNGFIGTISLVEKATVLINHSSLRVSRAYSNVIVQGQGNTVNIDIDGFPKNPSMLDLFQEFNERLRSLANCCQDKKTFEDYVLRMYPNAMINIIVSSQEARPSMNSIAEVYEEKR